MTFFVPRIQPGDDGAWLKSCRAKPLPPPLDWRPNESGASQKPASEAALLLGAGLPPPILQRIAALALRWGVPLREAALSTGAVKPHAYTAELSARCGFGDAPKDEPLKLRVLDLAAAPYRHLSAALPIPLDAPRGAMAVNGEQLSLRAAEDLAASLGPAKNRVIPVSRRALSEAIAADYGPRLAREAENGLGRKHARFSAATGVNRWQTVCLAMMGGCSRGRRFSRRARRW